MSETECDQGEAHSSSHETNAGSDLKFLPVEIGDELGGGWYRELPDAQIEVISRARLERVPLEHGDAEMTAREKITDIITRSDD